jgi:hypothetical protein
MATAATWMTSAEYSPKDVRAQQVALAPFHDQLAEALSVAVDHGPEQVVIADDRDGAVVALARLGLGQPDAGVFGIGEAAGRHDLVGDPAAGPEHGVLGGEPAFVAGAGHQHAAAVDVASGEDVGDVGLQPVVDRKWPRSAATPAAASSSP